MQINLNVQIPVNTIRDVPAGLLAAFADYATIEATVMSSSASGAVRLQVADMIIHLMVEQKLKPGDHVKLERQLENGVTVIKLSLMDNMISPKTPPLMPLMQGQQLSVEVVQSLAQNTLLVRPLWPTITTTDLPRTLEVDVTALQARFSEGDKLVLEVLKEQPLIVALKSEANNPKTVIQALQQHLLNSIINSSNPLAQLNQAISSGQLSSPLLRQAVEQLTARIPDKTTLQQPEVLRQSLQNSGVFLEKRLMEMVGEGKQIQPVQQDIKAGFLQLAQVLRQVIAQPQALRILANPDVLAGLPETVQKAVIQLNNAPQEMRQLPAQVLSALSSSGQAPIPLLVRLLTGLNQTAAVDNSGQHDANLIANRAQQNSVASSQTIHNTAVTNQPARQAELLLMRELLREVENIGARIQHNQLTMLRESDSTSNMNVWLFDLPIKDKQQLDMLQLRVERHPSEQPDGDDIWQIKLNLETLNLGPVQARITLHQQNVAVMLLAERESSAEILQQHLVMLEQRLAELGLTIGTLQCRQAKVLSLTADNNKQHDEYLLDISV